MARANVAVTFRSRSRSVALRAATGQTRRDLKVTATTVVRSILFIGVLLAASNLSAQQRSFFSPLKSTADSAISLPDNFPDFSTLRIQADSSFYLRQGQDYTIDTAHKAILLSNDLRSLLFPLNASAMHRLTVSYFALPLSLPTTYSRHSVETSLLPDSIRRLIDTSLHTAQRITTTESASDKADVFNNFQKSGSISRGFQVGSNRDLGLTSGFNLQFSGDVAKDVNITGALTEESTPIQPEGTTQTLNDIDKVFIRIKAGEHFTSTLGDFFLDLNSPNSPQQFQSLSPLAAPAIQPDPFSTFSQSTFDVVSRKLIGAEAEAKFDNGSVTIAGASPRGQFTTNIFQGQEAFQGPYRLSGKNGERAILIVAGTEHVYVDGVLQIRGERNDYIIDYALGEVVFQTRRLITGDSRITVDFQYSDQQYSRSLLAANAKGDLLDGAFKLSATYLREGDNQDAPLNLSLSDSDRALLSAAGNNPSSASKSGVTVVVRTATGTAQGSYILVDSLNGSTPVVFYRYAPLDTINAIYNVSFGYAGTGHGAYTRQGIGQFQFVGATLGDYDTLVYLPLPQLHQVMAFNSSLRVTKNFGLMGEFASSALDPNRFAATPSITDNAYRFGAMFADTIPILGYTELRATQRDIGKQFTPVDRIDDVEFQRRYGNDAVTTPDPSTTGIGTSELSREANLLLHPAKPLVLEGGYGSLDRPDFEFSSQRLFGRAELLEDTGFLPHLALNVEHLPTRDSSIHEQASWNRLSWEASKTLHLNTNALTLGIRHGEESKDATPFELPGFATDSLTLHSFSYQSLTPLASLQLGSHLTLGGQYEIRTDDSARAGALTRISQSNTGKFNAAISGIGGFSANADVTIRDKKYTDSTSLALNGGNQSTLLLRIEPRYALATRGISAEAMYEISNQRAARLERVFLPVTKGLGGYYYLGDLNHNGKPDAEEFAIGRFPDQQDFVLITLPTEQLFPTTDLRSNLRLRVSMRELFGLQDAKSWSMLALASISSESYIKLEETSQDTNASDIYFFHLSHFRNDSTTINGLLEMEQDFNILENDPDKSFRLHYLERSSAAQYNTGLEHLFFAERSIRARFRPSFEFTNETTVTSTTDQAATDTLSVNRPHNTSQIGVTSDISYHPIGSRLDYGARMEFSHAIEHEIAPELTAIANAATLRASYALETRARLRAEIERDELTLSGAPTDALLLPYSLTSGRSIGITWLWRLALDYQFGGGIVATVAYDGRNEASGVLGTPGERVTIHNARAEVRANF